MKRRNYLDQVCFVFADGTDKSCVGSNETDGWFHDDVNTRITFPCPYNSNRSHFHSKCISTDVHIFCSCINRWLSARMVSSSAAAAFTLLVAPVPSLDDRGQR